MKDLIKSIGAPEFLSRHWGKLLVGQAIVLVGLGFVLASMMGGSEKPVSPSPVRAVKTTQAEEGPTMWTCSMHPQIRQPGPGKCPICGMDLIPVAKTTGGMRTLTVSPDARALMQVETAPVERRYVTHPVRMVGKVDYDETRLGAITAWVSGRLDRLFVDYTGVQVKKGDHMASIYSEELFTAQQELIQVVQFSRTQGSSADIGGVNVLGAAREKLRLLGLTDEQIKEIEKQNKPSTHLTIYSPVSGIVIEKLKQEGDRVKLGDRIYTIADLNLVWVHLDAYESDLSWVRYGQDVTITTEAYPGEEFHGRIAFIQPVLNDKTRTVKVRVNVPNVDGKLKPEMFVHATVESRVAAGGRVMDPSLAGKWICPMHPEVIKDTPGNCDICGMALVRTESLGFVSPETDQQEPPLVIPYQAVLPTGTRAVVYVELPTIHSGAEPALQTLSAAIQGGKLAEIRQAFATYARMLDRPYDQTGTEYARQLWDGFAKRLGQLALTGQRAKSVTEAQLIFGQIEEVMVEVREKFAPQGQPTFEGREIVLGPRAGDFYLVRHGLQEGEMVVRQGNFKIDSEVQIQAKPSMMSPEGGGAAGERAAHEMPLPAGFQKQIRTLDDAYDEVAKAVASEEIGQTMAAFTRFGQTLSQVDGRQLAGHARMVWKELSMLLGDDAVEGQDAKQMTEADRVFLLLKQHMRRLRQQFHIQAEQPRKVGPIDVGPQFQAELAGIWERYLALQEALADDQFQAAQQVLTGLASAVATVDTQSLTDSSSQATWHKEHANLDKILEQLRLAKDIKTMREGFRSLSEEIGVLAKSFGFGEPNPVYELHCPMAFENQGAIWYQANDEVRNPYFGSTMLNCADRVERVER